MHWHIRPGKQDGRTAKFKADPRNHQRSPAKSAKPVESFTLGIPKASGNLKKNEIGMLAG